MKLEKTLLPALSASLLLVLSACILVVDGDGDWDGSHWHGSRNWNAIRGSGVSKSETRTITDFKRIEVNGSTDVNVAVGPATSLTVTADDNFLQYMITEVRDGTLVIEMKSGSYSPGVEAKIEATVPALEGVVVHGSSDVNVTGLAGEKFAIEISGSGDGRASGKMNAVSASVTGSGDLRLGELEAREAVVEVSGSGDVDVWVTEAISASIAGSGDVTFKGDPTRITKSVAGSGEIRKR